ncbi:hypothetical protein EIP91_004357 [Steccherinum ochraceum]|uniref:BTB domain-containing protein n=1 Tax=Steccherinum ochraceum TaxID=92696 RepID=A0A4R0R9V3_9APHY|nr:hypothetical protein EIP91_004357 [Steccherinum ochraceum]
MDSVSSFDRPDRDVVLLSSDQVKFGCHKSVLSIASPFFSDMFSLPQNLSSSAQPSDDGSTEPDGTPIIPMTEVSKTLDTLLRLIYPVELPTLEDPYHVAEVLSAARKYLIIPASNCLTTLSRSFDTFLTNSPLPAFAVACLCNMQDEVAKAADHILAAKALRGNVLNAHLATLSDTHVDLFMKKGSSASFYRLRHNLSVRANASDRTQEAPTSSLVTEVAVPIAEYRASLAGPIMQSSASLFNRIPPDVVLYTRHDVPLRAHKLMLIGSSPVLASMLDTSTETAADGAAILRLPESAELLRHVLHFCYGSMTSIVCPESSDVDARLLVDMVHIAEKYAMDKILDAMKMLLRTFIVSDPLQTYYAAVLCGWEDIAREAARCSLAIRDPDFTYVTLMEECPASAHAAFVRYYATCKQVLTEARRKRYSRGGGASSFDPDYNFILSGTHTRAEGRPALESGVLLRKTLRALPEEHVKIAEGIYEREINKLKDAYAYARSSSSMLAAPIKYPQPTSLLLNESFQMDLDMHTALDKVELEFVSTILTQP